jgi:hypothetical protein
MVRFGSSPSDLTEIASGPVEPIEVSMMIDEDSLLPHSATDLRQRSGRKSFPSYASWSSGLIYAIELDSPTT